MKRVLKAVLVIVAAIVVLDIGISSSLSYYDAHTKNAFLQIATRELAPGASDHEMVAFMQRHTSRYARDDQFHHEIAGIVRQTRLDRILFDRKVRLVLKMTDAGRFDRADVEISYTSL